MWEPERPYEPAVIYTGRADLMWGEESSLIESEWRDDVQDAGDDFWLRRRANVRRSARLFAAHVRWIARVLGKERLRAIINPLEHPLAKLFILGLMAGIARLTPELWKEAYNSSKIPGVIIYLIVVYSGLVLAFVFVKDFAYVGRQQWQGVAENARDSLRGWRRAAWGELSVKLGRVDWAWQTLKFLGLAVGAITGFRAALSFSYCTRDNPSCGVFAPFLVVACSVAGVVTAGAGLWLWRRVRKERQLSGFLGTLIMASEAISRGAVLTLGILFAAAGLFVWWLSVPSLITALVDKGAGSADWVFPLIGTAFGVFCFFWGGIGWILRAVVWSRLSDQTHGQARWARLRELRRARLVPRKKKDTYFGRFLDGDRGALWDRIGYPGPAHLVTIGPTRSGKGMRLIIPNLATLERSIFIIDPKGEAAAITARKRAKLGLVKIVNPFNLLAGQLPYLKSGGFNPLTALDPAHERFPDDCVAMAQALIREQSGSDGAFFTGSAQDFLAALIMHERIERREKASLGNVRKMLTERWAVNDEGLPIGLARTVFDMSESDYQPLRSKANRFLTPSRSNMDIISTATNETRILDSLVMQYDLGGDGIDWDSLKEKITTVYLILPGDTLETHALYLRLVVTSALRALLRSPPGKKLPPVLFMLDEFAQLGYLPSIENAMGIAAGFGVQLWPFLQDLNQLHALYKERWQTFIGARGMLTAFAPQDVFTADYLAKLCGTKTAIVERENVRPDSNAPGGGRGPQSLPLIRSEELSAMPEGQMLCLAPSVEHPFMTKAPGYWTTWLGLGLDRNPYHKR